VDVVQSEKRRKLLPNDTQFYITSFEFLSLTGQRVYDAWSCQAFTKDGQIHHSVTDNRKAACTVCKRAYDDVVKACRPAAMSPDGPGSLHGVQLPSVDCIFLTAGGRPQARAEASAVSSTKRSSQVQEHALRTLIRAMKPKGKLFTGTPS
jgi:hypothetical protein